jgi:hypothetical protein
MNVKLLGLVACMAFLGASQTRAATIYNIDIVQGTDTVTGTITTDGTIGGLSASNIQTWNLTIQNPTGTNNLIGTGPGVDSILILAPSSVLVATATTLDFLFNDTTSGELDISNVSPSPFPAGAEQFLMQTAGLVGSGGAVYVDVNEIGDQQFGPSNLIGSVGTTPLPAALPLFATGLSALGLLGWRRKRRNSAAIATT